MKFWDFALEFYTFIADNYATYFSLPTECTDWDSAYVMDSILYNESDLVIEQHYVDSYGYTEINYARFAMLSKKLSPCIRGVQYQRLYRIDTTKLASLVAGKDKLICMDWVED